MKSTGGRAIPGHCGAYLLQGHIRLCRKFADETESGGTASIRSRDGNLCCEYFFPMNDPETVLLINFWRSQKDPDLHHGSTQMETISALREKSNFHMTAERCISDDADASADEWHIRHWRAAHQNMQCKPARQAGFLYMPNWLLCANKVIKSRNFITDIFLT